MIIAVRRIILLLIFSQLALVKLNAQTYDETKKALVTLDKLKADKLISDIEYTEQRKHILQWNEDNSEQSTSTAQKAVSTRTETTGINPTTKASYQAAIKRVFTACGEVFKAMKITSEHPYSSVEEAKADARKALVGFKSLDLTGCPTDFIEAYNKVLASYEPGISTMTFNNDTHSFISNNTAEARQFFNDFVSVIEVASKYDITLDKVIINK